MLYAIACNFIIILIKRKLNESLKDLGSISYTVFLLEA